MVDIQNGDAFAKFPCLGANRLSLLVQPAPIRTPCACPTRLWTAPVHPALLPLESSAGLKRLLKNSATAVRTQAKPPAPPHQVSTLQF